MPATKQRNLRGRISDCSGYYDTKGTAGRLIDDVLAEFDLALGAFDCDGDSGDALAPVYSVDELGGLIDTGGATRFIHFAWYRLQLGNYEITCYLT